MTLRRYVPVVSAKASELTALANLRRVADVEVVPLIEMPMPVEDPAKKTPFNPNKEIWRRLSSDKTGLLGCLGSERFFLDLSTLDTNVLEDDGAVRKLFAHCEESLGLNCVPVIKREDDPEYQQAVADFARRDGRGVCVRAEGDSVDAGLDGLRPLFRLLDLSPAQADLVLDFGSIESQPTRRLAKVAGSCIDDFAPLSEWRSVTAAAGSFPSLLYQKMGNEEVAAFSRLDLQFSETLEQEKARVVRLDRGDYGIVAPQDQPGRLGAANLRYTHEGNVFVFRGPPKADRDSWDYRDLADQLTRMTGVWQGEDHCAGCAFSAEKVSSQSGGPGNSTQWRSADFCHHFTTVQEELHGEAA